MPNLVNVQLWHACKTLFAAAFKTPTTVQTYGPSAWYIGNVMPEQQQHMNERTHHIYPTARADEAEVDASSGASSRAPSISSSSSKQSLM